MELFDGAGGLVEGCIHNVHRSWLDVISVEDTKIVPLKGVQWHVYAAFGEFMAFCVVQSIASLIGITGILKL